MQTPKKDNSVDDTENITLQGECFAPNLSTLGDLLADQAPQYLMQAR